ncbi:MAG: catalase family protein [Proteobacteria bacterium]|nr:catalase family protein [Pseudomonadota bacterium]
MNYFYSASGSIPFKFSFFVLLVAGGCKSSSGTDTSNAALLAVTAPQIDPTVSESLWPNERQSIADISSDIEATVRSTYKGGVTARRDAHPKAHGCVKADFAVNSNLPPELTRGVFVPGMHYKSWIRFSNGSSDPKKPDIEGDGRGMAIKLTGVPGPKILETEVDAQTQDFIMINHPVFFIADPVAYRLLIQRVSSTNVLERLAAPLALGWNGSMIAKAITSKKFSSPLEAQYWSMVPYRFGEAPETNVMKFSAKPCHDSTSPLPESPTPNFLGEKMASDLKTKDGCFEFMVQLRRDPKTQPVEDPTVEWKESDSPFVKVATITIPAQVFNSEKQKSFCENLSYTPWHALAAHRPLGAVNRTRKVVYDRISTVRHQMNNTLDQRVEPNGSEVF